TLVRRLAKERVTCKTSGRIISDLCLNNHYTSQHSDIYAYHEQSLHVNLWPSSSNLNISFTRFINGSTVCGLYTVALFDYIPTIKFRNQILLCDFCYLQELSEFYSYILRRCHIYLDYNFSSSVIRPYGSYRVHP